MSFYKNKLNFYNSSEHANLPLEDRMEIMKNDIYRTEMSKYVQASNFIFNRFSPFSSVDSTGADNSCQSMMLKESRQQVDYLESVSTPQFFDDLIKIETDSISRKKYLELETITSLRTAHIRRPLIALKLFFSGESVKSEEEVNQALANSSIKYGFYSVIADEWKSDLSKDEKISYILGRYEIENSKEFDANGIEQYISNKIYGEDALTTELDEPKDDLIESTQA